MGICYWDAKMLWKARRAGTSFRNTLTVGHQALFLYQSELKYFRSEFESEFPGIKSKPLGEHGFGDYSDDFLHQFLGVESLSIMDFSPYEGANLIHDLNEPVSDELEESFDAVIDAGSLEHIFNFPVAISNLMKMLKPGGSVFIATPANNLCGHGFYQFSPELMFRIFTNENGFEMQNVVMYEAKYPSIEQSVNRKAYRVEDPEKVRSRVGLMSGGPVTLIVEARKIRSVTPFRNPPLQSDYVARWEEDQVPAPESGNQGIKKRIFLKLPRSLQLIARRVQNWLRIQARKRIEKKNFSFRNGRFYKRL